MNLRHMEVFRAVMMTGGVSGAAERLHISQPAVSKTLAHAARQAGLVLFERVKGRRVPTPEAQQLHAEIERLRHGVERLYRRHPRLQCRIEVLVQPHHGRCAARSLRASGRLPDADRSSEPGRGEELRMRARLRDARRAPARESPIEVRSATTACWLAQAGAGIAVVDRTAVAGMPLEGLVVRPFRSSERLEVRLIRDRYRPMSISQKSFCAAFDRVWTEAGLAGQGAS